MSKYNIIFISPHLDDVVYSCSQLLRDKKKEGNNILVITLFTQYDREDDSDNIFLNGKLRKEEDKEALEELGVDLMYLDYPELMIRDKLKDYSVLKQIVEPIRTLCYVKGDNYLPDIINQDLQEIINQNETEELYFPAAIGFHPDHILTFRACYNLKNVKLIIYEDFPYCIHTVYRNLRLSFINTKNKFSVKVNPEEKKSDIMKYKSQFKIIFEDDDIDQILKDYYEKYYII